MHLITDTHKQFLEHFSSMSEKHIRQPLAYIARWKNKQLNIRQYFHISIILYGDDLRIFSKIICLYTVFLSLTCTINCSHIKILQWIVVNGNILQWLPPVLVIGRQHFRSVSKIWLKSVLEKYTPFESTKKIYLPTFISKN